MEHHPALAKPNLEAGSDNVSCRQLLLGLGSNPDSLQLTAVAQDLGCLNKLTQKKTLRCVHPDLKPRNLKKKLLLSIKHHCYTCGLLYWLVE